MGQGTISGLEDGWMGSTITGLGDGWVRALSQFWGMDGRVGTGVFCLVIRLP